MKKQYVILMGLFFFIFTACGEYQASHDMAKTYMEFSLGRIEFQATQLKLEAYTDALERVNRDLWARPEQAGGIDVPPSELLLCDIFEKKIAELTKTSKKQFLFLCEVATREGQFNWLFENKTNELGELIAPHKSIATVLLDNEYFKPDSVWANFIHISGAKKSWWKNLF